MSNDCDLVPANVVLREPITVTMPAPVDHRNRGVSGFIDYRSDTNVKSVRYKQSDIDMMQRVADHYEVTLSLMMRWIVLHTAQHMHAEIFNDKPEVTL